MYNVKGQISTAPSSWAHAKHLCWPEVTLHVPEKTTYMPQELSRDSLSEIGLVFFNLVIKELKQTLTRNIEVISETAFKKEKWAWRICGQREEVTWYRQPKYPCKWLCRFRTESPEQSSLSLVDPFGLWGQSLGLSLHFNFPARKPGCSLQAAGRAWDKTADRCKTRKDAGGRRGVGVGEGKNSGWGVGRAAAAPNEHDSVDAHSDYPNHWET